MAVNAVTTETAKGKIVTGNSVTYDGGKYAVRIAYTSSANAINFCPYVVVSLGFLNDHEATFEWKQRIDGESGNNYKSKETAVTRKRYNVREARSYYASVIESEKKVAVTIRSKDKQNKIVTKVEDKTVDRAGQSYKNTDYKVTVQCRIGKGEWSKATINLMGKPSAANNITASRKSDGKIVVNVNSIPATRLNPVKTAVLQRQQKWEGESWSDVLTKTYAGDGDLNGLKNLSFNDEGVDRGNRYRYRIKTTNAKGDTYSASTTWYYTSPPSINVSDHQRLVGTNDTQNRLSFNRSGVYITDGLIRGFTIQCSNTLPTDSAAEQKAWFNLSWPKDIVNGYSTIDDRGGWLDPTIDDVVMRHITCEKDKSYRYRIVPFNYWYYHSKKPSGSTAVVAENVLSADQYFNGPIQHSIEYMPSVDGTTPTFNEPYEPSSVSATLQANGTVKLTVTRRYSYTTADLMFIQRKIGSGEWIYIPSNDGEEGVPIYPSDDDNRKYTFTDTELQGSAEDTVKYRVALACSLTPADGTEMSVGNGISKWKESGAIKLLIKPNPPTLSLPVNNSFVVSTSENIRLSWVHSPNDGTTQTAFRIRYKVNASSTYTNIGPVTSSNQYYDIPMSNFSVNDVIRWSVSTKGSHADYSDYSSEFNVNVYSPPSLTVTEPQNGSEISNLPLVIGWSYGDPSGHLVSLSLTIGQGDDVYREISIPLTQEQSTDHSSSFNLSDYLFEDNESYTLVLTAISSTGLSTSVPISIDIKYVPLYLTKGFIISPEFDVETGYASIGLDKIDLDESESIDGVTREEREEFDDADDFMADEEMPQSDEEVKTIYLYRSYNGEKVLVAQRDLIVEREEDGTTEKQYFDSDTLLIPDAYAPINVDFEYQLMQVTEGGHIGIATVSVRFESLWWYVYYGGDQIAKARWNPSDNVTLTRPEKQQVRYSGRTYPVTYDSYAIEEKMSFNTVILRDVDDGRQSLLAFKNLMEAGGSGIWKSFEGDVYYADFDFSYSADYTKSVPCWNCSINVTRIESEAL